MAAPVVETTVGGVDATFGSTHTISLNIGTTGNYLIAVITARQQGTGDTIDTATWNAVSMSELREAGGSNQQKASVYGLASPATGTNDLVITTTGNGRACVTAYHCSGVDTGGTPVGNTDAASGTGTSISMTVASDSDAIVVGGVNTSDTADTITDGADQVNGNTQTVTSGNHRASTEPGVASTTHSYSWTGSITFSGVAAELQGVPAGGTASSYYHLRRTRIAKH